MFAFFRDNPRARLLEAQQKLARVVDSAVKSSLALAQEHRERKRVIRALPVLLTTWENGTARSDACAIGLSKDFSGQGAAIVISHPIQAREVVVAFWPDKSQPEPSFFLGKVCHNSRLGGGFWQLGIEFSEFANTWHADEVASLKPIAAHLLPSPI